MKILAWIFGIIAALFMLAGCINYFAPDWLFNVHQTVSYFIVATSILLLAILCVQLEHNEKK